MAMRVEGGTARGVELAAPHSRMVRPTTSLTRQAIFSILENTDCRCDTVLDLYAGSGALGIEALSRGASWADFVDNNHECCTAIRQNLVKTGLAQHGRVHCMSAHRVPQVLERSYDVVFLDPPYDDASTTELVMELASGSILAPDALLIVSHGNRHPLADEYGALSAWKKRRYGDTYISIYRKEEH